MMMAAAAFAAMAVMMTAGAFAAENERVEANGIAFEIPAEFSGLLTVKTDDPDMLVNVFETASVEAAEALGNPEDEGAGWLFGISRVPEAEVDALRCDPMDGMEVFAEDDDFCLIYNHPTDVRLVRETQEEFEEGLELYGRMNQWAEENVPAEILANNAELDPQVFTNTDVDMFLAKAAYDAGTNFEVRSLLFADQDMPLVDAKDHLEELADTFVFSETDEEAPDGEYFVLAFPDENIRFDFFTAPGFEEYVREVYEVEGEEFERMFIASAKDADDVNETPFGVMQDWVNDILEGDD